jgi:hypothetical protein
VVEQKPVIIQPSFFITPREIAVPVKISKGIDDTVLPNTLKVGLFTFRPVLKARDLPVERLDCEAF